MHTAGFGKSHLRRRTGADADVGIGMDVGIDVGDGDRTGCGAVVVDDAQGWPVCGGGCEIGS
jgi:hypothetical protein